MKIDCSYCHVLSSKIYWKWVCWTIVLTGLSCFLSSSPSLSASLAGCHHRCDFCTDCARQMHEYVQLSANILSQNALKRSPHQHLAAAKRTKRPTSTASMVPQKWVAALIFKFTWIFSFEDHCVLQHPHPDVAWHLASKLRGAKRHAHVVHYYEVQVLTVFWVFLIDKFMILVYDNWNM